MTLFGRFSTWLLTDAGKKFSYFTAGTISSGVLLAHVLPHTVFLEQYKNIFHLYKNGFSVPLGEKLTERFQKALDLLEVEDRDRHLFRPFAAYGFDIFSAGSSYSRYGVVVGIPSNFFYDNVRDIDKHMIKIRDESIHWDLDEGQMLLNSLILSEKAQLYAMAREIKYRDTLKKAIDTVVSMMSCIGLYGLSRGFNVKLNLYAKPLILRLVLYCLAGAFAGGSYVLCVDATQVYYENTIDQVLKSKHPIFAEGGKEFYSKLLTRNIAMRVLMGKEGERVYSALGNENYLLRYRHMPIVQRKMFFEHKDNP